MNARLILLLSSISVFALAQDKGIKVFPFTSIEIGIFAKDEEQRDSYEAVLSTDPPFTQRIEELILEEGCRVRGPGCSSLARPDIDCGSARIIGPLAASFESRPVL